MKTICSFLPAATTMIQQMGLDEHLCGVTFECPSNKPAVVRSHIEGNALTSLEIDQLVSKSYKEGETLYYLDEELLEQLAPDIIITQDVCGVCQIESSAVERAIGKLKKKPLVISLNPSSLKDVYVDAKTIADTLGKGEKAEELLISLQQRTDFIATRLHEENIPTKKVMLIEWLDPIYNCGHWIPDQIKLAGGIDELANPHGYSTAIDWEKVVKYNPEVLVIAPCGFEIERATKELQPLIKKADWNNLTAVKNNAVYIADGDLFTQPSTRLIDGVEILASLFHPSLFPLNIAYTQKVKHLKS